MYLLEKDCILYKSSKKIKLDNYELNSPYEQIKFVGHTNSYTKIEYRWLDPIRIREKIISKDERSLLLIFYPKTNIIVCFGSSESLIGYVVNRIESIFGLDLVKIEVFNNYFETISADLINIHLLTNSSSYLSNYEDSNNGIVKLNINDIPRNVLEEYFKNQKVTLLSFKFVDINGNLSYFYVDRGSVVTFPDTMKEDVVYNVLEEFFQVY